MDFFRHYKNKPYKFHFNAFHSETREELTVYETLYENDISRFWIRPTKMFFENVNIEGKVQPRFKKVQFVFEINTKITQEHLEEVKVIVKECFGEWDATWFFARYNVQSDWMLIFVRDEDGTAIGFKLGYKQAEKEFNSWLGGVLPKFRGLGVGVELIKKQHQWCKENGYSSVFTRSQNRFRNMMITNLKAGFEIVGVEDSNEGGQKIIFKKELR